MSKTWFHLIASTYGSWLPGDEHGFRTRHHRKLVEGDYKVPPPEDQYWMRRIHAANLQQHDTVAIPAHLRRIIGEAIRDELLKLGGRVLAIAVAGQHTHIQVQLETNDVRIELGHAKRHAWFVARDNGWTGTLWSKRPKVIRIKTRSHQQRVYHYILDHTKISAWIWSELVKH